MTPNVVPSIQGGVSPKNAANERGVFDIPLLQGIVHEFGHGIVAHALQLQCTGILVPWHFIASDSNVYARGPLTTGVPYLAEASEAIANGAIIDSNKRTQLATVAVAGVVAECLADSSNVSECNQRFRTKHNFDDLKKFRLLLGREDASMLTTFCESAAVIVKPYIESIVAVAQQIEASCRGNAARQRGEAFQMSWGSALVALRAEGADV